MGAFLIVSAISVNCCMALAKSNVVTEHQREAILALQLKNHELLRAVLVASEGGTIGVHFSGGEYRQYQCTVIEDTFNNYKRGPLKSLRN